MRRYWVEAENFEGHEYVWLLGDQYQHIVRVCRQNIGSRFEVLQGSKAYLVEIIELGKGQAKAQILEERALDPLPNPKIHLVLSLPRFQKTDEIIEKAVELGVFKVWPVFSDFSFIRSEEKISEAKTKRWERIVVSATQQCGRGELMELASPQSLHELVENFNQNDEKVGLFFYEGEGGKPLPEVLRPLAAKSLKEVWAFVGSEGGFSEGEVSLFCAQQMDPITLGSQILRVETACTSLVSIIKYELLM